MCTAALFKNGQNQAIRLPKEYSFEGVKKVDLYKEGETLIIKPHRKSWKSFLKTEKADRDYLMERDNIVVDENRVKL